MDRDLVDVPYGTEFTEQVEEIIGRDVVAASLSAFDIGETRMSS